LPQPDRPRRSFNTLGDSLHDPLQLGITIVGVTAFFGAIGWWLDTKLHTFPILMAVGAAAGLFGIIYLTYIRLREADKSEEDPANKDKPPTKGTRS
jgi:hypothetical protein